MNPAQRRPFSIQARTAIRAGTLVALIATLSCSSAPRAGQRTFPTAEGAVGALTDAVKKGNLDEVRAIFGADTDALIDSTDPVTARRRREVFTVATAERWRLVDDEHGGKTLVIGNEEWPFPVPLTKDGKSWRFDTAAGKEEVIARRIGRNELAAIRVSRTFVTAQRLYARAGHDGKRSGLYAQIVRSDPGKHNGLYWPVGHGERRSPLGDLLADAAQDGRADPARTERSPFHGYYFKILTGQGASAPGGPASYVVNGDMSGGFALVAWPAEYGVTGIMSFVVSHEGLVREADLGTATDATAKGMTIYNPGEPWAIVP